MCWYQKCLHMFMCVHLCRSGGCDCLVMCSFGCNSVRDTSQTVKQATKFLTSEMHLVVQVLNQSSFGQLIGHCFLSHAEWQTAANEAEIWPDHEIQSVPTKLGFKTG